MWATVFLRSSFDREEDSAKVFNGGPWMIFDHYLAVSQCRQTLSLLELRLTRLCVERGRFARICVGKIWVRDHWYKAESAGLHIICGNCGCYDHLGKDCRMIKDLPEGMAETRSADKELPAVRLDHKETCNGSSSYPITLANPNEMHGECLLVTRKKKLKGDI
ncbi:hypothetical protein NC653_001745 [Populus alba x Populus x berolinensis]|uniref:DUF4283 domain-containing protein n=1 Tax=Populus alba x Populus x berolinensis TaxID=444605 RepID=A0AAD6WFW7_9ROSI|nr:hypothetical protein NC653_001745 [Populus alba x Populus x berolinensis]